MINVLIADDHPIVRQGLRQLLEDDRDERFGVMAEAANGKELLELLEVSHFDIILLDISMPGRSGLDLLPEIRKLRPKIPVLILSIYPEEQYAIRAMKLGASGYITKNSAPDELIKAIIKASGGGRYITASLAEKITFNLIDEKDKPLHERLSNREMEVLRLLAAGMTLSGIAETLSLSPKTISTYRERILDKLKLKTTSDIIRFAIKEELMEGE